MNKEAILEGLLYVQGDEGIRLGEVCNILQIDEDEAKDLVISLKNKYDEPDRGLRIHYLGNCFKLTTKEEHREYYKKLVDDVTISSTLSNAALETLAIIAYNEPITRLQIDELRGVDTTYTIRRLVAKGLIKECGRADIPGRPLLYKTTDDFLDYFNLSTKDDLPPIEKIEELKKEDADLYKSNYKEVF